MTNSVAPYTQLLDALWGVLDRYRAIQDVNEEVGTYETAEAVLISRLAVHDCLTTAGWRPPPHLAAAYEQDRSLLLQPRGAGLG